MHIRLLITISCLVCALTSSAKDALPIALVGDSYGIHEVTSITRNILDREDWIFETRGRFLPAEEFEKYALIVISTSQERPYTAEEHRIIRKYLEQGGRLLLIQQAPRHMADAGSADALYEWLGMKQQGIKSLAPEEAMIAQDPVLLGITGRPSWIAGEQGVGNLADDVQVLIGSGTGDQALVARRVVGQGRVYYLGHEVFRLRGAKSPHLQDSDSYLALIRNILAEANPLTHTDWQRAQTEEWKAKKKRFLLWNREWQRGTEKGAIFLPPLPAESELITALSFNLALDEYEALQLNLTDLGKGGFVTWKVEGLPTGALTVFVQDKPDPIPWPKDPEIAREVPFWLMPPEAVEPKGEEAVNIGAGETRIFWLKFDSHGLPSGHHAGKIAFSVGGEPVGEVAMDVTLHPVRVPKRRIITAQPFGHVYGDVNDAAPALRFKRNLRDHGFEWSLINTLRPETFTVDGKKLDAAFLKNNLEAIASENPPVIDFSSMDAYINAALEHNLTYFRITQNLTESIRGLAKRMNADEAQEKAIRQWYLREFNRYLKDMGIRNAYVSMGDEMSVTELKERFLPWSEDLAEAGWKSTSSFTTPAVADFKFTEELSRTVGAWTLNRLHLGTFMDWVHEGKIQLPEGELVGTYGAGEGRGTEVRKNASASRMIGWETWARGADYCSPNPYFKGWIYYADSRADRGIGGERFVGYLHMDDLDAPLVDSPFIEGIRESMEEANLAAVMNWYLHKLGDHVPAALRQRAERIVGKDEGSLLRWKLRQYHQIKSELINATREEYAAAKNEVLAILDELRGLARQTGIQPSLFWHNIPLIVDGQPVASIEATGDVSVLQSAIKNAAGQELPVGGEGKVRIVIGKPNGMKKHPENYSWIRDSVDSPSDQTTIWIGGTDEEQTAKALRRFTYFLRSEGAAFVD